MSVKRDLFAAIYADPDSDEPRTVLADLLLDEGDLRGEMIAKQLAGEDAAAQPLLEQHGSAWLGSLRDVVARAQFRRGFPRRVELTEIRRMGKPALDRLAYDAALGTIEHLQIGRADPTIYARLVASPAMTALRRIETEHRRVIAALRDSPAKIAHVGFAVPERGDVMNPDRHAFAELLEVCQERPEITSLGFDSKLIDRLIASPVAARLRSVEIFAGWFGLEDGSQLHQLTARAELRVVLAPGPGEPCVAGPHLGVGAIELIPDGNRFLARGRGGWAIAGMPACLALFPGQLSGVELEGHPDDDLRDALREARLDFRVIPPRPRYGFIRNFDLAN